MNSVFSRVGCYERCFECTDISIRGGNTQLILEDLFKGIFRGNWSEVSSAQFSLKLLLALSGPANTILPLKDMVKDNTWNMCG